MKRYQKIALCMIFSLAVQGGALCYADKILLKESDDFRIETIEVPIKTFDTNIEIPSEACNVKVSYGGKYIIYSIGEKIMLIDTKDSQVKEILSDSQILDCKWVPKNNTLYIVEKKENKVHVKTFNADSNIEQDLNYICDYKDGMNVQSYIAHSAQYISVYNQNVTDIYRIDIEKEVSKLNTELSKLYSGDVFWDEDIFVYQDFQSKKLYKYTSGKVSEIQVKGKANLVVLRTADKSIFLGELSADNKISKIIYSEDIQGMSSWKTQELEEAKEINDIYVTEENNIIINDSNNSKVTNISNGNSMSYKGKFVSINDRVLCSVEDGKISLKSVKETL